MAFLVASRKIVGRIHSCSSNTSAVGWTAGNCLLQNQSLQLTSHIRSIHSTSNATRNAPVSLLPPTILHSDNHILVVNKPPGWHSVPNLLPGDTTTITTNNNSKCLLTYLQDHHHGGGSQKTFLKPIHRIDQPCSGLLLWAKTSKAASRIARVWKARQVQKTYLCLVPTNLLEDLQRNSIPKEDEDDNVKNTGADRDHDENQWWRLQGYQHQRLTPPSFSFDHSPSFVDNISNNNNNNMGGWNVHITPEDPGPYEKARLVSLTWRLVPVPTSTTQHHHQQQVSVILVQAHSGARHMVRALLAQMGECPIHGDGRYGSQLRNQNHPRTVGLHAFSVQLPPTLQLGQAPQPSTDTNQRKFTATSSTVASSSKGRYFEAPIPPDWEGVLRSSGMSRAMLEDALRDHTSRTHEYRSQR